MEFGSVIIYTRCLKIIRLQKIHNLKNIGSAIIFKTKKLSKFYFIFYKSHYLMNFNNFFTNNKY